MSLTAPSKRRPRLDVGGISPLLRQWGVYGISRAVRTGSNIPAVIVLGLMVAVTVYFLYHGLIHRVPAP